MRMIPLDPEHVRHTLHAEERESLDTLLVLLYPELRRLAGRELATRPSDTLSATALVNELYLRLFGAPPGTWKDRTHFLAVAAIAMRHILVDRARRLTAAKRGGARRAVTLDETIARRGDDVDAEALLDLHDALEQLAATNARLARVVECRFFGGMTEEEVAAALLVTVRTVRRDWVKARALLATVLVDAAAA